MRGSGLGLCPGSGVCELTAVLSQRWVFRGAGYGDGRLWVQGSEGLSAQRGQNVSPATLIPSPGPWPWRLSDHKTPGHMAKRGHTMTRGVGDPARAPQDGAHLPGGSLMLKGARSRRCKPHPHTGTKANPRAAVPEGHPSQAPHRPQPTRDPPSGTEPAASPAAATAGRGPSLSPWAFVCAAAAAAPALRLASVSPFPPCLPGAPSPRPYPLSQPPPPPRLPQNRDPATPGTGAEPGRLGDGARMSQAPGGAPSLR